MRTAIQIGHDHEVVEATTKGIVEILNQKVDQSTLVAALDTFKQTLKIKATITDCTFFDKREEIKEGVVD